MSEFTKGELCVSSSTLICDKEARIVANVSPIEVQELKIDMPKATANAKELVRRWNAFEDSGMVDELKDACSYLLRVIMRDEPKGGSISKEAVELANAAITKVS